MSFFALLSYYTHQNPKCGRIFEFFCCGYEISIVDPNGIVTASTDKDILGYDIHSDPHMAEFLCLLDGGTDYCSREMGISPMS